MKKKKKRIIKIWALALAVTNCFILNLNLNNTFTYANKTAIVEKKATPYTQEEIKKMIDNSWEQLKPLFDKPKKTCILGAGGGWGLDDPYHYNSNDENKNRKMNDAAYLLMYAIPKYLDEDINVLFVNEADQTIKIPNANKNNKVLSLLPNINQKPDGTYDKYYSGNNQMWAVRYFTEKFSESLDAVTQWEEILDPITDDPVLDENTGKPMFRAKKVSIAPGFLAHISMQTNESQLHNAEGMLLYHHENDKEGRSLSEKIAENSKNSFTENNKKNDKLIFSTTKKVITKLGELGLPTIDDFFGYTDNENIQHKYFDHDAIERAAMSHARGINAYFGIDSKFANIEFEPVHDEDEHLKYVKIKIKITGYDIDKIKKCSIAILNAEKDEEINNPENYKKDLKIEESNGGNRVTAEFKFVPDKSNDVTKRCDTRRGVHNKFYIKIWQEKNNNESILIPCDVTNFDILQIDPTDKKNKGIKRTRVEVHPNVVYKKGVEEDKKIIPEWFEGTPEHEEWLKKKQSKN